MTDLIACSAGRGTYSRGGHDRLMDAIIARCEDLSIEAPELGLIQVGGRKDYNGFGQERILPAARLVHAQRR